MSVFNNSQLLSQEFVEVTKLINSKIVSSFSSNNESKLAAMVKLTEEVGELADQVLGNLGMQRSGKNNSKEDLENEMADVIIALIILAHRHEIDINKSLIQKLVKIKKRFDLI
jgi:NTP pyrophosphatase (non-canonical NTP hydrolase)